MSYEPPFIITARSINLISEISAQMDRFSIKVESDSGIKLRKVNRMKTIRGSLAIEGNTLSEEQVTALIEGKHVIAPVKEVQEVRNAISAYEHFMEFDPYNVKDLLKAHSIMTLGLVDNPGHFRKGGVCVAGKDGITHIAPPADRVPFLISDLFEWLKTSKDHILIKSSVFHYEFEFIHPFEDGNGRMGRFWQSRLLSDWNGAFEHLPIENMIWENQAEYYKVIEKATDSCDSGIFVEFMLQVISDAIHMHDKSDTVNDTVNDTVKLILSLLKENPSISYEELASKTGKSRVTISRKLSQLKRNNLIRRVGADKNGHWEVVKDEN